MPPGRDVRAPELKSVMTEHRKAVIKNRKRDLEAHHGHVHSYDEQAIAGGVFVINSAERFQSPLRPKITEHGDVRTLVEHCIRELRAVAERSGTGTRGLDAKCAIVLKMDNIDLATTNYLTGPPAPRVGDPLHYDAFIKTLCAQYTARF